MNPLQDCFCGAMPHSVALPGLSWFKLKYCDSQQETIRSAAGRHPVFLRHESENFGQGCRMSRHPDRGGRVAGVALLLLLALIIVLGVVFPPKDYVPAARWGAALESAGVKGMVLFLLAGMLATSIGLPRQLVAFIGGLAYGLVAGLVISLLAALCGCWLTATVSRRFFASIVKKRFPGPIATLDRLTQKDLFLKIVVLRLQPLGTNLLSNICIGFTNASLPKFVAASAVGYVPQMLVFNLLGVGVRVDSQAQLLLSFVLLLVSIALGVVLYKRHVKVR